MTSVPGGRIPGPRGLDLWRFLSSLSDRPHERFLELALRYGDIVLLDYPLDTLVVLAKPQYIEHVLHYRHQIYEKQGFGWDCLRQIWGYSMFTLDGDLWRRQRQRMQPAFHQDGMQGFAAVFVEEAQRVSSAWAASAARGEARDVYEDMLSCAMRALTRVAFGTEIEADIGRITHALDDINKYVNPVSLLNLWRVPLPVQRLVNPKYRRFRRGYALIHSVLDRIVRQRLAGDRDRRDLLGMIMDGCDDETSRTMTASELHAELINILMAGHETTGIATAWCWYWLSQYPAVERRLHEELDAVLGHRPPTFDDLANLPYTKMVFQEALRMNPPGWTLHRRAREDDCIDGFRIRRGTEVIFSPYLMHHHPKYWDEPDQFRPERFAPEQSAARPPYAYFPFGGGPRRCIGFRFAQLEGQVILATLAQSFSVRLKPGQEVVPEARLNLPPRDGVYLYLEPRRTPATATAALAH